MRWPPLLPLLLTLGCLDPEVPGLVTGEWGGEHLGMVASGTGANLEYDCATGAIFGGIRPESDGRFAALGEHVPGHGGPIRQDEVAERHPARYEGMVRGGTMTMTVTMTDLHQVVGTFTLVRGESPRVFKCL